MRATEHLKSLAQDDWNAATRHAFTDALADGSLKSDLMRGYLQQDYLFIDQFVRLLATTIAHAPTLEDGVPAAQFLGVITGPENTYFLRCFDALDIQPEADPQPETAQFQALMAKARQSGRYEQMLAVLVVAEWIYLDWASVFEDRAEDLPFWFGEWISLHCGAGFAGVVDYLRDQLDQAWLELDSDQRKAVEETFCEAVGYERAFFDAAWAGFPVTA